MKCTRCGNDTANYYRLNESLFICEDCSSTPVFQLYNEGLNVECVNENFEIPVADFEVSEGTDAEGEEKNSEEKFYCTYCGRNVTASAGADCDVDAGEESDENGLFDSGRVYPALTCDNCRYREAYRPSEDATSEEVTENVG